MGVPRPDAGIVSLRLAKRKTAASNDGLAVGLTVPVANQPNGGRDAKGSVDSKEHKDDLADSNIEGDWNWLNNGSGECGQDEVDQCAPTGDIELPSTSCPAKLVARRVHKEAGRLGRSALLWAHHAMPGLLGPPSGMLSYVPVPHPH